MSLYFDELDINDDILDALDIMHFEQCTPIQEQTIPLALDGHDILATAQTGTGKTAAYLIPILEMLSRGDANENLVNALILVPTRELAQQVDQLLGGFAYYSTTSWFTIFGGNDGVAFGQQQRALTKGGDIAIATPGRLLSLLRSSQVDLSGIKYFVLDEADRMLDIGFYEDIIEIYNQLPKEKQTLMFSATFPKNVEQLALKLLHNPKEVKIATSKPADGITQKAVYLKQEGKMSYVLKLFSKGNHKKGIAFLSSKDNVRTLYKLLKSKRINVAQIHSDLTNEERAQVLLDFKNNKVPILVATDVVARGIDIDDIDIVINYDVPRQAEDYVHRVGRTARAGALGEAYTLVNQKDALYFERIYKFVNKNITLLNTQIDAFGVEIKKQKKRRITNKKKNDKNKAQ